MTIDYEQASRYLSMLLRHRPQDIGLTLDTEGWACVATLVKLTAQSKHVAFTSMLVSGIVATDDKGRYELSADGTRVRAVQGHTTSSVQRRYPVVVPPVELFHGTVQRFLPAILKKGLLPMGRHDVHLSGDMPTAQIVGRRRGEDVAILRIDCKAMLADGRQFRRAENGVWLTLAVPARYLSRV